MKVGQVARVKTFVIKGKIIEKNYDQESDELKYLIEYKDENGEVQRRWFLESQLEG